MENEFKYSKKAGMTVEMMSQERRNMVVLRGKVLLNEDEERLSFVQNAPRGQRSVEIGRGKHSRIVRRPDGLYTLTLRFDVKEKFVREAMIAEVRNAVNMALAEVKEGGKK